MQTRTQTRTDRHYDHIHDGIPARQEIWAKGYTAWKTPCHGFKRSERHGTAVRGRQQRAVPHLGLKAGNSKKLPYADSSRSSGCGAATWDGPTGRPEASVSGTTSRRAPDGEMSAMTTHAMLRYWKQVLATKG